MEITDFSKVVRVAEAYAKMALELEGPTRLATFDAQGPAYSSFDAKHPQVMGRVCSTLFGPREGDSYPGASDIDVMDLWAAAYEYVSQYGLCALAGVVPATQEVDDRNWPPTEVRQRELQFNLPDGDPVLPALVGLDYYGRNPRAQVMFYEQGADDEPAVQIRLTPEGKVAEIVVNDGVPIFRTSDAGYSPWSIERDGNPPCVAGELLRMPSGQWATVERLQERYQTLEEFTQYARNYGIMQRLDNKPGMNAQEREGEFGFYGYSDAWDANPLIASTTVPSDFSIVPERNTDD